MQYYVYILISHVKLRWSYVGSTSNLISRFQDHKYGKVQSTKAFRPLELAYFEKCDSRIKAYERELYLKTGLGREEKKSILDKYRSGIAS